MPVCVSPCASHVSVDDSEWTTGSSRSDVCLSFLHLHQVMEHLQTDPSDPHLRRRLTEDYDFGCACVRATTDSNHAWACHPTISNDPPPPALAHCTDVAEPRRLSSRALEDPKLWTNPLSVALPKAPKMKILCFYGVGKVR